MTMRLQPIDWIILCGFLASSVAIGAAVARRAGSSASEFFLAGRQMPWWLLGVSMVATTFSTDTPNLVTDIVRNEGVSGNWVWWAFLLTGMLTTFVYARLWRRSGVETDMGFYEVRYSGKAAAFLRGFRAIYLGVFFNVMIMATVTLAAIKIGGVMMGLSPVTTVLVAGTVTVIYSMLGGLTGVLITDFLQFGVAMFGSIAAAWYALAQPEVGGLGELLSHPEVAGRLSLLPDFSDAELVVSMFFIPLAVQWWATWYPGAEPGGGGYIAQRMLAARDERHAMGAMLLFNAAHYALRPWPWIIVALCSVVVFPDLESLRKAFPHVDPQMVQHDLGYPAMLTFLPAGLLGLVIASLTAAYMSTMSTHLNWGSSYLVNDVYRRFVNPKASEAKLVRFGRGSTFGLMVLAGLAALRLSNALEAFQILLQIGAGTGLLFILRWFWDRINAASEIAAMTISFLVAFYFHFLGGDGLTDWQRLLIGVIVTTIGWLAVTFTTTPTDQDTLQRFHSLVHANSTDVPVAIANMVLGCTAIYGVLFAAGSFIYGENVHGILLALISAACTGAIVRLWGKNERT